MRIRVTQSKVSYDHGKLLKSYQAGSQARKPAKLEPMALRPSGINSKVAEIRRKNQVGG